MMLFGSLNSPALSARFRLRRYVIARSTCFLFCIITSLLIAGCSGEQPALMPVTGRVTMQGKAVTAGAIYFHPDAGNTFQKDSPSSQLQLDGSFTMKTFPFGEGVPPGRYKVTLVPELASRLQRPEYGSSDRTPWEIEVKDQAIKDKVFEVQ
jgi:hypothetical protein